ncbi:hypothetical protein BLS_000889 [Venturia inaequalis]|uniref:Single-strand DNA deaminase toxin A-like C-terminal domain-containing protein n=1 Tax=Venturia inaequalis TaxID=5025 RepID=A0A8H3UBM6_VENIN|nr:hypothetical protein BLS_000889 [Venturia inaequalis]KAE9964445.1 hypothetical protein EG328_010437 [Venturia inaequalis]KAE9967502.1 hypothetical protein EG327_011484 [Venturia inaequalis]RDI79666.1 hypothetical protein Vi05172_g10234 [Venturia inaequalis]
MASQVSYAPVQWWTSRHVYVLCPFCREIHIHGFGGSYDSLHRGARCCPSSYNLQYPFSPADNIPNYEIDKYNARYVAVGANPPSANAQDLNEGLSRLHVRRPSEHMAGWLHSSSSLDPWKDPNYLPARHFSEVFDNDFDTKDFNKVDPGPNRIIAFGDIDFLEDFLCNSSEAVAFLEGIDEDGNSALMLAAREKFSLIVERLLDWGAEVDFQNTQGRTPLMEASLWGRHDNVQKLLDHDADKDLRDIDGLKAVDLARASSRNAEERLRRSGPDHRPYSEKTYAANQARRLIVQLLDDADDDIIQDPDLKIEGHRFRRRLTQGSIPGINLISPTSDKRMQFPSTEENLKPIAWLARSSGYTPIPAMSGGNHGITTTIVSGHEWTEEVMHIAEMVGHRFEEIEALDQGQPGYSHASHAEKQLIAYFVNSHVFLPSETEKAGRLLQLALARPPVMLERAKILVDWEPCKDCFAFLDAVNDELDVNIEIVESADLDE